MNIFVLSFRVHLTSCMLLCALCSLCNEHKLNKKKTWLYLKAVVDG